VGLSLIGLKATYGRLSRARTFPFVASLDHVGPLARSTRDLALAYDAMQGPDPGDPVCAYRTVDPVMPLLAVASTLFHRDSLQNRTADADLGALPRRLAGDRRPRQHH
jgi:Asp-tRNA(Asn)/Glu-tRNA(Gln) amidotransferase A subunit family amidase